MNVLAIDTSSAACVLGLQFDDRRDADVRISGRSHSRDILPAITDLLEKNEVSLNQLDYIVFGQGPGSFTGLRIAVGVVQGLGYGLNIPVVPVSSLACLAQAAYEGGGHTQIVVALHARQEEVFLGTYVVTDGIASASANEMVVDVKDIAQTLTDDWIGVGDGWILREQLETAFKAEMQNVTMDVYPDPEALLNLGIDGFKSGRSIDALNARPKYLREHVATPSKNL